MKKFVVIFVMMIFAFSAKAQEVTALVWQYQTQWYYLSSLEITLGTGANVPLPLGMEMVNTNTNDLLVGDTVAIALTVNDSIFSLGALTLNNNWKVADTIGNNLGTVNIPTKYLKTGENEMCAIIIYVTVNKIRETIMTTYCSTFQVKSTSVVETDNLKQVQVYPNPVNSSLKVENLDGSTDIGIYNVMGQVVRTIPSATGSIDVNMDDLSNGLYFVRMQNGQNVRTEKIQVVK